MPAPTFMPEDKKQDERLNPGQQDYDRRFNDVSNAEQRGSINMDDFERNYGETADSSQEDANIERARSMENKGSLPGASEGGWNTDVSTPAESKKGAAKAWFKKRGPLLGIGGGVGIIGIMLSMASSALLPVSIMQNMTDFNDSSSVSMGRRGPKVLQKMITGPGDCKGVKINCKTGRISNSALRKLEKKGLVPKWNEASGGVSNAGKRLGYPSRNPDSYAIVKNGKEIETVAAKDIRSYLAKNSDVAAKVLGRGGAFNLRVSAWASKTIGKRLFNAFKLKKDGGIADGKLKKTKGSNFASEVNEKLLSKIPALKSLSGPTANTITKKATAHLGKAKKGGTGYTLAVASCIGVKAPGYIAAGVAAIQLAQLIPIINDVILSPGSKIKASGVMNTSGATPEDIEAVGILLTEKTKDSDGQMTSALDSPYLQSAIGINTNKTPVSKEFAPGFAFLTSGVVVKSQQVAKKTESACNTIMSPAAMYSAMAVDAAVTVAASSTIILGVVKVAGSFVINEIASKVTKDIIGDQAKDYLVKLAENDNIPKAKGKALGDVLGIAGSAYFSTGGMAHGLPTLKQSQIADYVALKEQDESEQRAMDIASLSPFDTSSKYTFLGSITHKLADISLRTNAYQSGPYSLLGALTKLPFTSLIPQASAAVDDMKNFCGYASDFNLDGDDESQTPAINMAGLPCTGLTTGQSSLSPDEAIDILSKEGWFDEDKDVPDNATYDDLLETGYIKKDTPLADFIETCTHGETGDYLFNAASCTIDSRTKNTESITQKYGGSCIDGVNEDGESVKICAKDSDDFKDNPNGSEIKSNKALEAMSVFLIDFQIAQSINGEDNEADINASSTIGGASDGTIKPSTETPANTQTLNKGWTLKSNVDYSNTACAEGTNDTGTYTHPVAHFTIRTCEYKGTTVASVVSQNVVDMFTAAEAAKVPLSTNSSFRSYENQKSTYNHNCDSSGKCKVQTAKPGGSQHERGLALDIADCATGSARFEWLSEHAASYGYYNLPAESWHWSLSGY